MHHSWRGRALRIVSSPIDEHFWTIIFRTASKALRVLQVAAPPGLLGCDDIKRLPRMDYPHVRGRGGREPGLRIIVIPVNGLFIARPKHIWISNSNVKLPGQLPQRRPSP